MKKVSPEEIAQARAALQEVVDHAWTTGHLAHTSDTAAEAIRIIDILHNQNAVLASNCEVYRQAAKTGRTDG